LCVSPNLYLRHHMLRKGIIHGGEEKERGCRKKDAFVPWEPKKELKKTGNGGGHRKQRTPVFWGGAGVWKRGKGKEWGWRGNKSRGAQGGKEVTGQRTFG